jgi:hypothetical protein
MGVNEDLQLVAVHTHINLVGWASLALFGVIYRLYPELAASRLALVHFWLSAPSAAVFPAPEKHDFSSKLVHSNLSDRPFCSP